MANVDIVIPYLPRKQFLAYHAANKRFAVTVAHRRAGKSVARVNRLVRAAVECQKENPRYGYIAPFFVQAKEIAWRYLLHYSGPFTAYGLKKNESELSITFPHNNATVRLYGAENAERIRGVYFDGIVVDEAQGISRSTLSAIILPALADRSGWLDCSGTPRGWSNLLGELVKLARETPDIWFLQILKASETGILPADELARQRSLMSENEYEQEFECNFDAAITGAVYGKQIAQADAQNRITTVPHLNGTKVHTAWDLGYKDATAIWWFQILRGELHILDYYENNLEETEHYCTIIKERAKSCGYDYGTHYVPQDAGNEMMAAGGRSIVQQALDHGVRMKAVPFTSQMNGIEAGRVTMRFCWFDREKCDDTKYPPFNGQSGMDCLRNYQFLWDEDKKVFRDKPHHDWASHAADAFELLSQVWREPQEEKKPAKPRFLHDLTFQELIDSTPSNDTRRI